MTPRKDANFAAKKADFRVFQTHLGRCYDTEGYASLHPRLRATRSARAFDLSGRAAVKRVTISLGEADFARQWYTTPVAALPLCGANHKSASPRLSGGLMGLRHLKHKLDHRDNDSRAIFSFVSQFLSDSNKKSIDATLGWLHLL